jgi:NAD(P)H dehydrogenase (quinone)
MYAITGIAGKVGGETARHLIGQGASVRAVLRSRAKAADWAAMGCDIAIADMANAEQLAAAFSDVEGVFRRSMRIGHRSSRSACHSLSVGGA